MSFYHVYRSFSAIGIGLVYTSSVMVLGSYFTAERLVLANGISFAGISTGQFVLPPLLAYLYAQYGWRGGTLLLAGIKMNLIVCGALFRPKMNNLIENKHLRLKVENKGDTNCKNVVKNGQCRPKISEDNVDQQPKTGSIVKLLYRNVHYLMSLLVVFFIAMTQFGGCVFMIPRATDVGIPPFQATLLVTFSAVSGALGSLGHGILIRRKYATMHTMFIANSVLCAISFFTNPWSDHFAFLVVNMCIFALTLGVITALIINPIPRQIVEWRTPSLVDPAIGVVIFTSALGQTVGMVLAGKQNRNVCSLFHFFFKSVLDAKNSS